jgi:hypothetical protein
MNRRPSRPSGRITRSLALLGAAAGLVTWLYDHAFFLNAAGPETPISDAILRATGAGYASPLVIVFWPAVALVLLGMCGGLLVSWLFVVLRR